MKLYTSSVLAICGLLILSGCQTTKKTIDIQPAKVIIIEPPKALLTCPAVKGVPDFKTLTNKQVVQYIDKLYKAAKICNINMDQINKFIEQAKRNVQQ